MYIHKLVYMFMNKPQSMKSSLGHLGSNLRVPPFVPFPPGRAARTS